jgi:ribonuclease R
LKKNLNGAIDKDEVLVKIIRKPKDSNAEGFIYRILAHGYNNLIGTVRIKKNKAYVELDERNYDFTIDIKDRKKAVDGSKVVVELIGDSRTRKRGRIKKIIGHENDVGIDIISVVYKYGFDINFDDKVIKETKKISERITNAEIKKRRDLRDKLTITIDGADAKDLDDAISLEMLPNKHKILYVSIADVAYYVKENSALDKEALNRGTSVYLVDRVVPMLPHYLSNGVCSLLPNQDRLTQTCEIEFDQKNEIIRYEVYESLINSDYRLTYDIVNQIFDKNAKTMHQYQNVVDMLQEMHKVSLKLRKERSKRGSLDFKLDEPKIIVNKQGKVLDIVLRHRGEGEKMIEDFMICANECVAKYVFVKELPFIYRIHERPNKEKMSDFLKFVSIYNIKLRGSKEQIESIDIQYLLDDINSKAELAFLNKLLLKSMSKARYDRDALGHFGLASEYYSHFTSPIRRYPDLIAHRLLRTYFYQDKKVTREQLAKIDDNLLKIGEKTSQKERDAIEAEREVNDLKMAEYMEDKVGQHFKGKITSVLNFGLFVELENTVEGLVHISNMDDDQYTYNEKFHRLEGKRNKNVYKLGQEIEIEVILVNVKEKQIDFKVIKESNK